MGLLEEQKNKLMSMQIKGIIAMITSTLPADTLEARLLRITLQQSTSDVNKLLESQNRATLIQLIELSPEITTSIIDETYNKYKYGLKPGFTLYWFNHDYGNPICAEELDKIIKEYIRTLTYEYDDKYKKLDFVSSDCFEGTFELNMTFLQRFNYIDEDAKFTHIYMLKDCFIWVNFDHHFIAINNLPDVLSKQIIALFRECFHAKISNIVITNKLLKSVFSDQDAKRITKHSSNPPSNQLEKITIADKRLSEKQQFIPTGYDNYDTTNTQYSEKIDDKTFGMLGINCYKGKLSMSKSLSAIQFREWSLRRIDQIIEYYQDISDVSLEAIIGLNMFSGGIWEALNKEKRSALNEIAYALIKCKTSNLSSFPFESDILKIRQIFPFKFIDSIRLICTECDNSCVASCPNCNSSAFTISKVMPAKLVCGGCGESFDKEFTLYCENGHQSFISNLSEIVELIPTASFLEQIQSTISRYRSDIQFSQGDYFSIYNGNINLHSSCSYAKISAKEIDQFRPIAEHMLISDTTMLESKLKCLREKCASPTNEKCMKCKQDSSDHCNCILRLFAVFDSYTPQPHQGHEFGDVSMLVSYKGESISFVGIAKPGYTKITKGSSKSREMIQQTIDFLNDSRADIIGIIYPHIIDNQLKNLLYTEAILRNKKMVILDHDFMIKLMDYYLNK